MSQDAGFRLGYYLDMLLRKRWVFLGVMILTILVTVLWSYSMKKVYSATTMIYVEESKVLKPLMEKLAVTQSMLDRLKTIHQMMLSRSNLFRIMQKLGMDLEAKTPQELEWEIERLREDINIDIPGHDLFEITFQSDSPKQAMDVANALAEQYIEDNLGETRQEAHGAYEFIHEQLAVYRAKLEGSEKALLEFKLAHRGEIPHQGVESKTLSRIEQLTTELITTRMKLKDLARKQEEIQKQLKGETPIVVAETTGAGPADAQLQRMEAALASMLMQYTEKHPDVIRLKQQIEEARKQLQQGQGHFLTDAPESMTTAANPVYQQLRSDLQTIDTEIVALQSRENQLVRLLRRYEARAASLPKREQELAQLTRDNTVNTEMYKMLLERLEDARMSKEMEVREKGSTFRIIDPAILPLYPVKPDRIKIVFLGLVLGILLGAGIVVGLDHLAGSFKGMEEVTEALRLPVLASIPAVLTQSDRLRQRRSNYATAAVVGTVILGVGALILRELMLRNPYLIKEWLG